MSRRGNRRSRFTQFAYGIGLTALLFGTGCQVNVGGQTLPSPYYLQDDIQYFAPGPEFPLANEAAAQQVRQAEDFDLDN
ncbi:MAG: hypothetical protein N2C12_03650 [Planctomycetales bacterium]